MKDEKLIYAVRNIDDDLICEAMKRRSNHTEPESKAVRAVYVSGKRKGQILKYSAAVAALLAVTGGTVFIVQYQNGIKNQLDFPGYTNESEEQRSGEVGAVETEVSSLSSTAAVTEPAEEVKKVVPLKVRCLFEEDYGYFTWPAVIYVDSYPETQQNDLSEEYFTEMSTKELLEYYGFYNNLAYWIDSNQIVEITDENTHHGIYTLPDGSVYDINSFKFKVTENSLYSANQFTVTIGKKSKFGQEYIECMKEISKGKGDILKGNMSASYYNEDMDTFFKMFDHFGLSFMFSATTDEITNSFFAGDPETTEYGSYPPSDKDKNLMCSDMLTGIYTNCFVWRNGIKTQYFDKEAGLWYDEKTNCYLNEETFEWIPAEEWDFD